MSVLTARLVRSCALVLPFVILSGPLAGETASPRPHFEPNTGQFSQEYRFVSRGPSYTLLLAGDHANMVFADGSAVRLSWHNSCVEPHIDGEGKLTAVSHYLRGSDPKGWRTGVPHYRSVRYTGLWHGIDLVFHGDQHALEYDFVVLPGVDPQQIAFMIEGVAGLGRRRRRTLRSHPSRPGRSQQAGALPGHPRREARDRRRLPYAAGWPHRF